VTGGPPARHAAEQRIANRPAELGFDELRAYMVDRLGRRPWPPAQLVGELGAASTRDSAGTSGSR
jgi:hypothetical protein